MTSNPIRARMYLAVASAMLVANGCVTTTYESFRSVGNTSVDIAYVADSADFSKFKRLKFDGMGIFCPTGSPTSAADLERVRDAFRAAFLERVKDYEIVEGPADDVLATAASLVDLRNASVAQLPDIGRDINEILEPGKLTFMIELRDSTTNALLLRAADTSQSPRIGLPEGSSAGASEVETAARHWADLFGNFLDSNLRGAE